MAGRHLGVAATATTAAARSRRLADRQAATADRASSRPCSRRCNCRYRSVAVVRSRRCLAGRRCRRRRCRSSPWPLPVPLPSSPLPYSAVAVAGAGAVVAVAGPAVAVATPGPLRCRFAGRRRGRCRCCTVPPPPCRPLPLLPLSLSPSPLRRLCCRCRPSGDGRDRYRAVPPLPSAPGGVFFSSGSDFGPSTEPLPTESLVCLSPASPLDTGSARAIEALAPPANRPEATRQAAAAMRTREPTASPSFKASAPGCSEDPTILAQPRSTVCCGSEFTRDRDTPIRQMIRTIVLGCTISCFFMKSPTR